MHDKNAMALAAEMSGDEGEVKTSYAEAEKKENPFAAVIGQSLA